MRTVCFLALSIPACAAFVASLRPKRYGFFDIQAHRGRKPHALGRLASRKDDSDGTEEVFLIGEDEEEEFLDSETLADIEAGQPSQWMVMKEVG